MSFRPPAVGSHSLQPRVDDHKGDERRPIPVAVPIQPFTGYHANPAVRPAVTQPMQGERKAPDLRMEGVTHSFRPGSGRRPPSGNRPPRTGEREEVYD